MTDDYKLKAVLLDWAGTTMDYGCMAPAVVFREVFAKYYVPISMEEARGPMGKHKRDHIRAITQIPRVSHEWKKVYGEAPNETDVEKMFKDFVPAQLEVLADYSQLIPGTLEAVAEFRKMGLKIGSTTGYTTEMMKINLREAAKQGYVPDSTVCASEVPEGRPAPWMCLENAKNLGIYPMSRVVKVGDTVPDVLEGKNAGMWTVGLAKTGNEIGLPEDEIAKLSLRDLESRLIKARGNLVRAGADFVVDGIWDVPEVICRINYSLKSGRRPINL